MYTERTSRLPVHTVKLINFSFNRLHLKQKSYMEAAQLEIGDGGDGLIIICFAGSKREMQFCTDELVKLE